MGGFVNWSHDQSKLIPARIVSAGSESDEIGVPHAWQQLIIDPKTGSYRDHEVGLRGTFTNNPAYALDGGVISEGSIVYVKVRGWSYKVGVIFDIISSSSETCDGDDGGDDGGGGGFVWGPPSPKCGCVYKMEPEAGSPWRGHWVRVPEPEREPDLWRMACGSTLGTAIIKFRPVTHMSGLGLSGPPDWWWDTYTFHLTKEQYQNGTILFQACVLTMVGNLVIAGDCDWGEPAPPGAFFDLIPEICYCPRYNLPSGGEVERCRDIANAVCWLETDPKCYCDNFYECLDRSRIIYDPRDRANCGSGGLMPQGSGRVIGGGTGSSPMNLGGGIFRPNSAFGPTFEFSYDSHVDSLLYESLGSWSSGGASGWWSYGSVSSVISSTPVHNYAPGNAKFLLLSTDSGGTKTLTGLSMGQVDGQEVCIKNTSPMDNIVIQWEGTGSLAVNRFVNPPSSGSDTILPGGRVVYKYTSHLNRWVKVV